MQMSYWAVTTDKILFAGTAQLCESTIHIKSRLLFLDPKTYIWIYIMAIMSNKHACTHAISVRALVWTILLLDLDSLILKTYNLLCNMAITSNKRYFWTLFTQIHVSMKYLKNTPTLEGQILILGKNGQLPFSECVNHGQICLIKV